LEVRIRFVQNVFPLTVEKVVFEIGEYLYEVDVDDLIDFVVKHGRNITPEVKPGMVVTLSEFAKQTIFKREALQKRRTEGVVLKVKDNVATVKWNGLKHPEQLHINYLKPL